MQLTDLQKTAQSLIEEEFTQLLYQAKLPEPLAQATFYAVGNGGKRVRPMLALATFLTLGGDLNDVMIKKAMLAVELIHSYSLVHDDLPCMDDDDLRRGKPTCHKVYGEATALLSGDVLQALAFEVISANLPDERSERIGFYLSRILASCARRMVLGQQLDLNGENKQLSQQELELIHQDKTGALIEAAVLMGGMCASATDKQMNGLQQYAKCLGLAFQVQDDVLDVISDTQTLGKMTGADEKLQKSTYVKLLGVQDAKNYADLLFDQAKAHIGDLGKKNLLTDMADWLQVRQF